MLHRVGTKYNPQIAIPAPPQPLELDACYRYCEAMARARHHNFPVASTFVPSELRKHIWAVYAFARAADDFADECQYEGRRSAELDSWQGRLHACYFGERPDHPVFVALSDTIKRFNLPITEFNALLNGFRADLDTTRYATYGELVNYANQAAAPVGRLVLYLGGYRDPQLHRYSDDLCTGLTLAKLLQEIIADVARDRIYIPGEDLRHFGVSEQDIFHHRDSDQMAALVRYEVSRARALFERARPVVDAVGDNLAVELALVWHGGLRILHKISRNRHQLLNRRPRLSSLDKAQVVLQALRWRGNALTYRVRRRLP